MTNNASKNYIVNQSRFSFKQKMALQKATQSCADLALRKYEEQLKSGKKYNKEALDEHAARVRKDIVD